MSLTLTRLESQGLFGEDGIFYSLQHILDHPAREHNQVYSMSLPPRRETLIVPWWQKNWIVALLGMASVSVIWLYGPRLVNFAWRALSKAYHIIFDLPLRELYRYGPSIIGWEGANLPEICSRITYHGDREFWSRNIAECQRIYATKEEAFLRVTQPVVYSLLTVICFFFFRNLVATYAENRRGKDDAEMIATYRAFQTLVHLSQRTAGGSRRRS